VDVLEGFGEEAKKEAPRGTFIEHYILYQIG
jgi:hypothetical protein